MQHQQPTAVYGITKAEYAKQLQELEQRSYQPRDGFFARLRSKFR